MQESRCRKFKPDPVDASICTSKDQVCGSKHIEV